MKVVTRFAPSPTGHLHIGGARTALFNWAFARHHGGAFYLRFEDTDRARSSLEYERVQLEAMTWLGIDHDPVPGPTPIPRQSEREGRYREVIEELIARGAAYRCICTPAEVDAMRERAKAIGAQPRYDGTCRKRDVGPDSDKPFCVRLRVPDDAQPRWVDEIAGPTGQDGTQLDDFVLMRSDGSAIYHFAVVVDDHDMAITHVIRGWDHLTSTPRQLLIYAAMGWPTPSFAHVPLFVGADGKKLSKRENDVSVEHYREQGFLPEALLNFIARLGWSHGDLEVFSTAELVSLFDLSGIGRSPAQVGEDKLLWLNQHYIQQLSIESLFAHARSFLEAEAGGPVELRPELARLLDLLRPRARTLRELAERARFYLREQIEIDPAAARKHLGDKMVAPLEALHAALSAISAESWRAQQLEPAFQAVVQSGGIKLGDLAQATRVAIVGSAASPGIFDTLEVVGRARALDRLAHAKQLATDQTS